MEYCNLCCCRVGIGTEGWVVCLAGVKTNWLKKFTAEVKNYTSYLVYCCWFIKEIPTREIITRKALIFLNPFSSEFLL